MRGASSMMPHGTRASPLAEAAAGFNVWTAAKGKESVQGLEPRSVLDHRSISPPTSSSSLGGGGRGSSDTAAVAALSGDDAGGLGGALALGTEEWASELRPILGSDDWEMLLSHAPAGLGFGGLVDSGLGFFDAIDGIHQGASTVPSCGGFPPSISNKIPQLQRIQAAPTPPLEPLPTNKNSIIHHQPPPQIDSLPLLPPSLPSGLFLQEPIIKKSQLFSGFPSSAASDSFHWMPSAPQPQPIPYLQLQKQAMVDQLIKAAELVETGDSTGAHLILARLNHQLPSSPHGKKPLIRSAFYFKESLHLLLANSPPLSGSTPLDVVSKLEAHKAFAEVSPLVQFTNFTCTQSILEAVGSSGAIHVVDFDIGVGSQWSSFMRELAFRRPNRPTLLKITAFVAPSSHHPLELELAHESLSQFAADLGIQFEFRALCLESFDPVELLAMSSAIEEDAIAVNLPIESITNLPISTLIRLLKQLSPKIVITTDQGCNRGELPFTHHFLHSLQSYMVLMDSLDAMGTSPDVADKIERFLMQPRIQSGVLGRYYAGDKILPWRTLFETSGFVPVKFSNFAETQAECILKRVPVRGFHVEKRQVSLFLNWHHRELASVSAWRG